MTQYWFKPRRYGAGATLVVWQGWAAIVAFPVVCLLAILAVFAWVTPVVSFILLAILLPTAVTAFINFVRKKTDGQWGWRWGDDKLGET